MRRLRVLVREPGFAALTVATVTLAVGANVAVFAVVDGLWLRPRPVRAPDRVVVISNLPAAAGATPIDAIRSADLAAFDHLPIFDGVAGQVAPSGLMGDFRPRVVLDQVGHPVETLGVTARYFSVLGARVLGRDFSSDDDRFGAPAVGIVSEDLWRHAFAGDPTLVNRIIATSHGPLEVIGIAPAGFHGARLGELTDLWIPRELVPRVSTLAVGLADPSFFDRLMPLVGLARLKPGVSPAEAARAIATPRSRFVVYPLRDVFGSPDQPTTVVRESTLVALLGTTAALVLASGCLTLLALLLVHYERRRHELAIRVALGASPSQLARQLGLELVGLAAAGAVGALVVADVALRVLPALRLTGGVDLRPD